MRAALLLLAAMVAGEARGSTPGAWAQMGATARRACATASGLRDARASAPLHFSDAAGRSALLVTGTYPQPHMRGARSTMLCLYDRQGRHPELIEAIGWRAP